MKKIKIVILCAIALMSSLQVSAQDRKGKRELTANWQVGLPLNDYVDKHPSGWGADFDLHSFVKNNVALGAFVSWQTYMKYFDPGTTYFEGGAVTMGSEHTIYQLPFGLSGRCYFTNTQKLFDPYLGVKIGANYSRQRRYYNAFESTAENWGLFVSPSLGVVISQSKIAFHLAVGYEYATNKSVNDVIDVDGLSGLYVQAGLNFRM